MTSRFRTRAMSQTMALLLAATVYSAFTPQAFGRILDASGYVVPEAVDICRIVASAHGVNLEADSAHYSTLEVLHAFGESALRRPEGSEQLGDAAKAGYQQLLAPVTAAQRQRLVQLFDAMGDVGNVEPAHDAYDYILIYGSTVPEMRRRLSALATSVLKKNFEVGPGTQVIFFDGERPPFAKETLDVLLNPSPYLPDPAFTPLPAEPNDERGAAELVYRQLWLPIALREAQVSFVHAPIGAETSQAHTQEVVRHWLQTAHPRSGRALLVSSNPFVEYQRLATLLALREEDGPAIELEAMGPEGPWDDDMADAALGVRLDNLAASLTLALKLRNLGDQEFQSALQP